MSIGRWNRNVFSWRRKVVVDRSSFSCVGSVFHARGAATEKALSSIRLGCQFSLRCSSMLSCHWLMFFISPHRRTRRCGLIIMRVWVFRGLCVCVCVRLSVCYNRESYKTAGPIGVSFAVSTRLDPGNTVLDGATENASTENESTLFNLGIQPFKATRVF